MLRSQTNWSQRPGSFDAQNTGLLFPSDSQYGMPEIAAQQIELPELIVPFNAVKKKHAPALVHTFIEDYQLERLWKFPARYIPSLTGDVLISPDFSLYTDMPLALQIYNTYRNRYIGRFFQEFGIQVIPSVGWSTAASFAFCFEGIEPGGTVAISSSGTKRTSLEPFMDGVKEMIRCLEPARILCYGSTRREQLEPLHPRITYLKTFSEGIRERVQKIDK